MFPEWIFPIVGIGCISFLLYICWYVGNMPFRGVK